VSENYQPIINKIFQTEWRHLNQTAERFSDIYLPISILPPDQYMSMVVQLTEGCSYNKCTFCNFYRDRPFRIKSHCELKDHLQQIKELFGEGALLKKSIFLADANALAIPQNRLLQAFQEIVKTFPEISDTYSFIDVFTGLKKTEEDFKQLAQRGLKRAYLGVESGNHELLEILNKEQSNSDIIDLVNMLKAGGISIGIIFLAGAGGVEYAEAHECDSIELIKQLQMNSDDIIYVSEFYQTNEVYERSMLQMNIEIPSRKVIHDLAESLKFNMKKTVGKNVPVSIYDINQFFY
jgi:radical SAM superfamily enzyme YgiQ (UPF0313 family)